MSSVVPNRNIVATVLIVALGYFVDIFDLILFSVVRVQSLQDMGLSESAIFDQGISLLNIQMIGMLVGGMFFGILADRVGRLPVLLFSIILYSLATLANAFVSTVETYSVLRFIAGFGLAGELGIGVTLISEVLPQQKRSYGIAIVAGIGMCGAMLAWPVAKLFDWRTAYLIGGVMGLVLLVLRVSVLESNLFIKQKESSVKRGDFLSLFRSKEKLIKFLACIFVGIQLWFIMGILIVLSPELTSKLGISQGIIAGESIFYCYLGVIFGGFFCGIISQHLQSRKKTLLLFMLLSSFGSIVFFFFKSLSQAEFYSFCVFLGFAAGYWSIFVQTAAEQFGTNLRATVTTSVTNFGRATLVPISMLFSYLKDIFGLLEAGLTVAVLVIALSFFALFFLQETFKKNLDYSDSK